MNDPEKQVLRALDTYKSAVLAKNAETFMHLYDPEVRVFDTWGIWSYEGAAAWRVAVEGWFSSLGNESVRVTFEDVKITSEPGFASMSAFATYAALSAEGQELQRDAESHHLGAQVPWSCSARHPRAHVRADRVRGHQGDTGARRQGVRARHRMPSKPSI